MQRIQTSRQASFTVTSSCSGCSGERLAPTVVPLAVASSGEDLDHLEVECTRSQQDPSSAVRGKVLVEADRGKVDGHRCSVALGVSDEGGCGIVAANP